MKKKPLALIILDGWGEREAFSNNPIKQTATPTLDELFQQYPHTHLEASGPAVGLPEGQMGNSEVGHLHLGSGRLIRQDLMRISTAIETGQFQKNPVFLNALEQAKKNQRAIHIIGLLSPGGVHSHEMHIFALIELCHQHQIEKIYVHPILDGRDTPPQSALSSLEKLEKICKKNNAHTLSLIGRYYAMDRDNRWQRIQAAYDLITTGEANYVAHSTITALEMAYQRGETDEFVKATRIANPMTELITMADDDIVIFMNFRADRARQLSMALTQQKPLESARPHKPRLSQLITLTEYSAELNADIAFPTISIHDTLGECLAKAGLKQLRLAETEKYAHVTYFFNGSSEVPNKNEDRLMIPSPAVATYDLQPAMSAEKLTDALVNAIKKQQYDVIICNYANPDMIGHTGNEKAACEAVATIDHCLNRICTALKKIGGEALLTADHGNIEQMHDEITGQPHTAHTTNLVPFLYVGPRELRFKKTGTLADVAPTILTLLNLPIPEVMDGENLLD